MKNERTKLYLDSGLHEVLGVLLLAEIALDEQGLLLAVAGGALVGSPLQVVGIPATEAQVRT